MSGFPFSLTRLWLLTVWLAAAAPPRAQDAEPPAEIPEAPTAETADRTEAIDEDREQLKAEEDEEESVVPQAYPEDRYLAMWDKNPFKLETAPVIQQRENFSKDWTLAGISASGGVYTVRIFNKQTGAYQRLREGQPSGEFRLDSVNFHKDRNQSSVKITRGTETAELKYDDSLASRPVTVSNTMAAPAGDASAPPGQGGALNPNLPPGAQASLIQRGPNGQPLNMGAGTPGLRPGMPGYAPGRPGGGAAGTDAPGIDPATGAPLPGGGNPVFNPAAANPAMAIPGAAPAGVPSPVSRRRQLIPAPIQQKQ